MAQQKALFLDSAPNGPWVVRPRDIQKPGKGELLVKIHATALNPVDWKIRAYNFFITEYPAILGTDASGTVEELGEGVTGFAKGDEVLFQGYFSNDKATFQQYSVVPSEITAKLPSNVSFDEGASIPLALATAVVGLYGDRTEAGAKQVARPWEGGAGQYKGQPIVVFGGSSSVGQYTIQLAHLSGFSPIITTASLHNADLLKSLGATHVVDRKANVIAEVQKITGGKPVDFVYDAIAEASTQAQAWEVLAPGGTLVLVLPATVDKAKYPDKHIVNMFANFHDLSIRSLGVSLYSNLTELLQNGTIKPNRVEVVPNGLAGIAEGLTRLQENKVSGTKLIARPLETV